MADYNISSGVTSTGITLYENDNMNVSSGGIANDMALSGYSATMYVYDAGTANDTAVNEGRLYVKTGGTVNHTTVDDGGELYVFSSGSANSTTVNKWGDLWVFSGGTADSTGLYNYGRLLVENGGIAENTKVNNHGSMYVMSGGTGYNTTVSSGGELHVSGGGMITGSLDISSGAIVSAYEGSTINFDVRERTAADAALINDWSLISGAPDYTITIKADQAGMVYALAAGAADFNESITIGDGLTVYGSVALGNMLQYNGEVYGLFNIDGTLSLTIGDQVKVYSDDTLIKQAAILIGETIVGGGNNIMHVSSGGSAIDTTVNSGGELYISSGGMTTGSLNIESGAIVSAYEGAIINFDISDRTVADAVLINDLSLISGSPDYTITISAEQTDGVYKLAGGASDFGGSITIGDDAAVYGNADFDNVLTYNDNSYRLRNEAGNLSLIVNVGDLVVEHFAVSSDPAIVGDDVTLNFTVQNTGAVAVGASYAYIYADDVKIGQVEVGSLAVGDVYTGSYIIAGGRLTTGLHNLRIDLDADNQVIEANEDNNSAAATLTINPRQADLVVESFSASSEAIIAGGAVTLCFTVQNVGTAAAVASYAHIYDGDVQLAQFVIRSLAVDEDYTGTYTVTAGRLAPGEHNLRIVLNAANQMDEADETNNSASTDLTVKAGDLVVERFTVSSDNIIVGENVTLDFAVKNDGDATALASHIVIYDGNVKLEQFVVNSLKVGDVYTGSYTIAGDRLTAGSHNLRIELDASGRVIEHDENNNVEEIMLTVNPKQADLLVESLDISSDTVNAGEVVTLNYKVQNVGIAAALSSYAYIYDGDVRVGQFVVGRLDAGEAYIGSCSIDTIRWTGGEHNLRIELDATDRVAESNEANNSSAEISLTVNAVQANLVVESFAADSDAVVVGEGVTLNFTIQNAGTAMAAASYADIYDGNVKLGRVVVSSLAVGDSFAGSYTITGDKLAKGSHNLRIELDATDRVVESNEADNFAEISLMVNAGDLVVESFTVSSDAVYIGDGVTLNFTIQNAGTAMAAASYADIYDGDIRLARIAVDSLDVGASYVGSCTITGDRLAVGEHNLRIELDSTNRVNEFNEADNSATTSLTVNSKQADLVVESFVAASDAVAVGEGVTLNFTVQNIGMTYSQACYVDIYDGDIKLGRTVVSSLNVGDSYAGSYSIAGGCLPVGEHNLRIELDATDCVAESNESDNSAVTSLLVNGSDLVVESFAAANDTFYAGEEVTLNFTILNAGAAAARASYADIYDGDVKLTRVLVSNLAVGESFSGSYSIAANKLATGSHDLRIELDATDRVVEASETNNSAATSLTVNAGDLVVDSLTANSSNLVIGEGVTLTFTVSNIGNWNVVASYADIYDGDVKLGQVVIDSLAPGASYTSYYIIAPNSLDIGSHDMRIVLDATERVAEYNETNNSATTVLSVSDRDLVVESFTASSDAAGEDVELNFTVKNNGRSYALASYAYIYDGNVKLGQVVISSLNGGDSYSGSFTIAGNRMNSGVHNFVLVLDATNRVIESNEDNNTATASIMIAQAEAAAPMVWNDLGSGDFDGDGLAEQLLLNEISNEVAIQIADSTVTLGTLDSAEYELVGIADFNNDGFNDILWSCQGENTLWQIRNNTVVGVQKLETIA